MKIDVPNKFNMGDVVYHCDDPYTLQIDKFIINKIFVSHKDAEYPYEKTTNKITYQIKNEKITYSCVSESALFKTEEAALKYITRINKQVAKRIITDTTKQIKLLQSRIKCYQEQLNTGKKYKFLFFGGF